MEQQLNQNWKMRECRESDWQEARVPGTVYTDLLRNGRMEDPFFRDNEDAACALMEQDYEYECSFPVSEAMLGQDAVLLHFDGLDTVADIFLNGTFVGHAENMHRTWEYQVRELLSPGENTLCIHFFSPLKFIAEAYPKYGTIGNEDTYEGFMHLRKAHYMFGWDWGAHLPDAGIFRPVKLIGISKARIDNVRVIQDHRTVPGQVRLQVLTQYSTAEMQTGAGLYPVLEYRPGEDRADGKNTAAPKKGRVDEKNAAVSQTWKEPGQGRMSCRIEVSGPDGTCVRAEENGTEAVVEHPRYWWPNGLGEQPLYRVRVELLDETGSVLDTWEQRIGLRTLTVRREKDAYGESFAHEVNGLTVFAMGADYIPEDHLLGRGSREKTRALLTACKEANFNTVRVWGGGCYPEDWFYDICDELGLMVWQDFMFACSVYELTPEFEANIRREFADNIKRLRHHASLALWCGNNEMEMFVEERCWVTKATEVRDYLFMYERILPEVLREYDPDTFYWPASPSSGGSFDVPNDPDRGDVHYWEVWHGNKPFTEYRKHFFRYASEFGFQSFPALRTIEKITDRREEQNPFSYVMEKHQRNYGANGKIMNYMQQIFLYPNSFEAFLYGSQLLQAEAIRYGVEHFRRNRGRCMGAIYWQLNDCWPVISWSSIDYCGRWKALHYYAKRFFAPLMISCEEAGMMSAEANMNRQHFAFETSIRLNVANETRTERRVTVCWALRRADGSVKEQWEKEVTVPALSAVWLEKQKFSDLNIWKEYVSFGMIEEGQEISSGTVIFSYPKYFQYQDPKLRWRLQGDEIIVSADAYAKSVEIQNGNQDLVLSDNYFDMNGGEKRVRIVSGEPEQIQVRSVYDIR